MMAVGSVQVFRFMIRIGQPITKNVADHLRIAGCIDVVTSSTRIYWSYVGADKNDALMSTLKALKSATGTTFGIRPRDIISI